MNTDNLKSTQTSYGVMWYRPDTIDEYIIKQHKGVPLYYRDFPLLSTDIVLDIGANIGTTVRYAAANCKKVIGCEPDPDNFSILRRNTSGVRTAKIVQCFVSGDERTEPLIDFYLARGTNYAAHSAYISQGRQKIQVPVMRVGKLCETYRPTYVKLDCEGGEYEIVPSLVKYPGIRAIAMEAHLSAKAFKGKYEGLVQCMEEAGYLVFSEHKTGFHSEYYYVNAIRMDV